VLLEPLQKALELGGQSTRPETQKEDNSNLWQNPDVQRMQARLSKAQPGLKLSPWMYRQTTLETTPPDGLNRQWPAPANDVAKHQGYAVQWFGLASLCALLWLWFVPLAAWKKRRTGLENVSKNGN
jgi:cytochrome oxidase assembly protein ShyY1